eukprot:gene25872-13785_t
MGTLVAKTRAVVAAAATQEATQKCIVRCTSLVHDASAWCIVRCTSLVHDASAWCIVRCTSLVHDASAWFACARKQAPCLHRKMLEPCDAGRTDCPKLNCDQVRGQMQQLCPKELSTRTACRSAGLPPPVTVLGFTVFPLIVLPLVLVLAAAAALVAARRGAAADGAAAGGGYGTL